ncbi:PE domain-containing protein [Actinokineospora inagensis]|uniref:PE domain-containing protein n=1 Tax=Actinokineospora inagensis TaxID=103730 RepID=UPI000687B2CF|nr:PE domain-containing protein [Actinokineospora inagensis]
MAQPAEPTPVAGRGGYLPPEEQAKRRAQDEQYDLGMNSVGVKVYQRRQQEDAEVNAAAASGGYVMDIETMRRFLPRWQAIADKLSNALNLGAQLGAVKKPADDEASTRQKQAADAHAEAYLTSAKEQHDYALGYAKMLKTAIDTYERQEQTTAAKLLKHGRRP